MRIGFLGFGEAARAFRATLAEAEAGLSFVAWDILLSDPAAAPAMRAAMAEAGVREASGPDGFADCDWVISAVTAGQSLAAVEALAPGLVQGQLVVDINSVSPGRKRETAALVEGRGARYLDMAVMTPVHPKGHRSPVLVAGPEAAGLMDRLAALGFDAGLAGEAVGAATAVKMVRSLFVKGLEALTVETLLAAEASGCREEILASLAKSYPGLGWPGIAAYQFERVMTHGRRRGEEMRESAATLDALGLTGDLARAIAEVQERTAKPGVAVPEKDDPGAALAEILRVRLERG